MHERVKAILKNLIFFPFSTIVISPPAGTKVEIKTTVLNRRFGPAELNDRNQVVIPSGTSAEITVNGRRFEVQDYRERPGHAHGAKIKGLDTDENLWVGNDQKQIPGLGSVIYRKN